jgi:hypothetical protein
MSAWPASRRLQRSRLERKGFVAARKVATVARAAYISQVGRCRQRKRGPGRIRPRTNVGWRVSLGIGELKPHFAALRGLRLSANLSRQGLVDATLTLEVRPQREHRRSVRADPWV